jgi:hypothetical protein
MWVNVTETRCESAPRVLNRTVYRQPELETFVTSLWYGVVANGGLRSDGTDGEDSIQERVLYPAHRSLFTGRVSAAPGPLFLHLGRGPAVVASPRLRRGNRGELLLAVQLGKKAHQRC